MSGCFMMQNSEDIAEDFVGSNFARWGTFFQNLCASQSGLTIYDKCPAILPGTIS